MTNRLISRADLQRDLAPMAKGLGKGPLLLHTDLARLGRLDHAKSRDALCADYVELLQESFPDRPLLFPTFNYDFCTTGVYHRQQSPSQVGALTDYLRRHYAHCRSLTPVFHFCILRNAGLSLEPTENCFGEESLFAELVRRDGSVAFLGAPFSSNTFLHHIEEFCDVTYRYHKTFSGVVVDGEHMRQVTLLYRVRPLDSALTPRYDWSRLEQDLKQRGILQRFVMPRGYAVVFRAVDLFTYWSQSMRRDERFLLEREEK
jgi:aminoglycoside 3-N-acetyltransferase